MPRKLAPPLMAAHVHRDGSSVVVMLRGHRGPWAPCRLTSLEAQAIAQALNNTAPQLHDIELVDIDDLADPGLARRPDHATLAANAGQVSGPETTRVLFRATRDGEVTAVFPDQREGRDRCGCYAHVGQHGQCDRRWVTHNTRPAKPAEYAALKAELEAEPYGYELVAMARVDRSCFG